jgi:hypothetical protein
MKKILAVAFFCLPAFGQAAYSGHGLNSVSSAYTASVCGPPDYAPPCSISDTAIHPYVLPIQSWGPNTCDSTSMATLAQCGNLTGAGTVVTTNDDFHAIMTRCTDATTSTAINGTYNPFTQWQTADAPSINLWNSDDTALMLHVLNGNQWVFLWDGSACHMLLTPAGAIPGCSSNCAINFPGGTVWSRSLNNHINSMDNTTGPGIYLNDVTLNLTQNNGSTSISHLFDFTSSQCLMNTVNGFPTDTSNSRLATVTSWSASSGVVTFQASQRFAAGQTVVVNTPTFSNVSFTVLSAGRTSSQFEVTSAVTGASDSGTATATTFPLGEWLGGLFSQDGIHFAVAMSELPAQGTGFYLTSWAVGQSGCDILNTATGVVTHNGTLVGTVSDAHWQGPSCPGGTCGAKGDRFFLHDSDMPTPNIIDFASSTVGNRLIYGTYTDGDYFWTVGTTNLQLCGAGGPNWQAGTPYFDGDRVLPLTNNAGNYIYQIINGVSGTSSAGPITWNQTVNNSGSPTDTTDGPLTWRNTGVGAAQEYFCDGHAWKGYLGLAAGSKFVYHTYADPSVPQLGLGPKDSMGNPVFSAGDQHLGNTQANTTETNWLHAASTDAGTAVDLLHGPLPSALYMEEFFVAPPNRSPGNVNCVYDAILCPLGTLGQVRRVSHCYGTGWNISFDTSNCISIVSQTGKYEMVGTDAMGQFGSSSGHGPCNVGAQSWTKNNSTFHVGDLMLPDPNLGSSAGNNAGAYIFKVLSCSGAGGSCLTSSAHPASWPQGGTPGVTTLVEASPGTITWTLAPDVNTPGNAARQDCRSDVMVVKLTR